MRNDDMSLRARVQSASSRQYRGTDRRGAPAPPPTTASLAVVLVILLVVTVGLGVAATGVGLDRGTDRATAGYWLTASTAAVAFIAGALYAMRWRLVGNAAALWMAAALVVYGVGSIAVPGLSGALAQAGSSQSLVLDVIRPTSVVVVLLLIVGAIRAPDVDTGLRPRRIAAVVVALGALTTAVLWPLPSVRAVLGSNLDGLPATHGESVGQAAVASILVLLAAVLLYRSLRRGLTISPLLGATLLALAEGRLAWGMAFTAGPGWMLTGQLLRLVAVGAALIGAARDLNLGFAQQREQLLESILELQRADARERAAKATEEERTHDVRSALCGISGAAVTLERYHDQLGPDERTSLASALTAEIARLQHLVTPSNASPHPAAFAVRDVVAPMAHVLASQGMRLELDVPDDVRAWGRAHAVAEIVQNLIDNARVHAPDSPVTVRAEERDLHVAISVADRGPGVSDTCAARIFERGWRGSRKAPGSGLGLYVAARLAREQGGDLRVEPRPGGGASFVLTLPAAAQEVAVQ